MFSARYKLRPKNISIYKHNIQACLIAKFCLKICRLSRGSDYDSLYNSCYDREEFIVSVFFKEWKGNYIKGFH